MSIVDDLAPITAEEKAAIGLPEPAKSDPLPERPAAETVTVTEPDESKASVEVTTDKAEDKETVKEERVVPLAALQEARQASKAAREEARIAREQATRMEKAFAELRQRLTPKEPEPTLEDNPVEFLKRESQKRVELEKKMADNEAKAQAESTRSQQIAAFQGAVVSAEAAFRKEAADYDDAVEFAKTERKRHLTEIIGMDDAEADNVLRGEILFVAETALRKGKSPAQAMYSLAKSFGYKAAPAAPATPGEKAVDTADKLSQIVTKAAEKVAQIKEGKKASSAMSGADGGAPAELTLERLSQLQGKAFDQAFEKMFGAGRRGSEVFN